MINNKQKPKKIKNTYQYKFVALMKQQLQAYCKWNTHEFLYSCRTSSPHISQYLIGLKYQVLNSIKVEIRDPFQQDRLWRAVLQATNQAKFIRFVTVTRIYKHCIQLHLTGLNNCYKISNINMSKLKKIHERLDSFKKRVNSGHSY